MPTAAGLRRTVAWTCRALLSLRWPEDPPRTQLSLEGAPGCLVAATWAGAQGWRLEVLVFRTFDQAGGEFFRTIDQGVKAVFQKL